MPVNKPTTLPRWATGLAVITEPTEPEKDTGFVPGTPASAAHTNWLLNRLYQWLQYLDDPATVTAGSIVAGGLTVNGGTITTPGISAGALTATSATVSGSLSATGAATVGGALGVTGRVTASGGITVPVGQTATLQGATTVGGTLGVTGAATFSSGLTVPTGQVAALQGPASVGANLTVGGTATVAGTLGVTGLATTGGLTATANAHVTVSGTGDYKHGDKTLQLPASAGVPVNIDGGLSGQPATSATGWRYGRSVAGQAQHWYGPVPGQEVVFPVTLKVGDRIKSIAARIQDTSGAGNTITMYLHKSVVSTSFFSGSVQVGATQTSLANGTVQTLTLSGLTATINSFEMYNVSLRANGTAFTNHRILGVQVTYDRP
ncbi:MAG: hypothetical protein KBG48_24990 [Kofleriaceae bacterium]|nr:hypothetical protein [Kofleriaceae bacterium]MBP9170684.1 hypothetical protein [Kofleriaceae bacterium]MBP9860394.1 hypothetical protein [Kofleriaceae bacterium]